jgi:internalin A
MTRVGDGTLESVHRMSSLIHLSLFGTQITDEGLSNLYGLKNLTALDMRHTALTATGIAQLRAALPDCKIIAMNADLR